MDAKDNRFYREIDPLGREKLGSNERPAFPNHPQSDPALRAWAGMTMRQYYAGQALPSIVAGFPNGTHGRGPEIAAEAFEIADAMIAHEAKERADG